MSDRLMTTTRPAPTKPREHDLQTEASAVEQLRRKIAAMPGRGEVATPQLLAEFARAQKAYLDKKIEFEKRRRAPEETAPDSPAILVNEPETHSSQAGSPANAGSEAVQNSENSAPRTSIWRIVGIIVLFGVLAGLAAAAWIFG